MAYKNKRGIITFMLVFFVFFALFTVIIVGTTFYGLETFNSVGANLSMVLGNVSFQDTYQDTVGGGIQTVLSTLSTASFMLLLGMIVVMLIIGFKMPERNNMWIILDIFIIIVAFIAAVYISIIFESFINSNEIFLDIYSVDLQRTSTFILNLPFIIAIVGAMIVVLTYVPRKPKTPNVLEFN